MYARMNMCQVLRTSYLAEQEITQEGLGRIRGHLTTKSGMIIQTLFIGNTSWWVNPDTHLQNVFKWSFDQPDGLRFLSCGQWHVD